MIQIWRENDRGELCLSHLQYFGWEPQNQVVIPVFTPSAYASIAPHTAGYRAYPPIQQQRSNESVRTSARPETLNLRSAAPVKVPPTKTAPALGPPNKTAPVKGKKRAYEETGHYEDCTPVRDEGHQFRAAAEAAANIQHLTEQG